MLERAMIFFEREPESLGGNRTALKALLVLLCFDEVRQLESHAG
jgi:hypothetical protein